MGPAGHPHLKKTPSGPEDNREPRRRGFPDLRVRFRSHLLSPHCRCGKLLQPVASHSPPIAPPVHPRRFARTPLLSSFLSVARRSSPSRLAVAHHACSFAFHDGPHAAVGGRHTRGLLRLTPALCPVHPSFDTPYVSSDTPRQSITRTRHSVSRSRGLAHDADVHCSPDPTARRASGVTWGCAHRRCSDSMRGYCVYCLAVLCTRALLCSPGYKHASNSRTEPRALAPRSPRGERDPRYSATGSHRPRHMGRPDVCTRGPLGSVGTSRQRGAGRHLHLHRSASRRPIPHRPRVWRLRRDRRERRPSRRATPATP